MGWTERLPTRPGWWWNRCRGGAAKPVEVWWANPGADDRALWVTYREGHEYPLRDIAHNRDEWSDRPIQPPA
jgi:hypothetical protein